MLRFFEHVSVFCFAASYAVAFAIELWHLFRPRPVQRMLALGFGIAGLVAHAIYLTWQCGFASPALPFGSPTASLFFVALILAVFYLGETVHHQRVAWALFVLPLVLGLIGLGLIVQQSSETPVPPKLWVWAHLVLVLLAAVGVSIGFIASVMYLVQLRRLQAKLSPRQGPAPISRNSRRRCCNGK